MKKQNILIGVVALLVLWVLVFLAANAFISNVDKNANIEALPTPTQRPIRTDVPELRASPEPTDEDGNEIAEATEEVTEEVEATQEASETPEPTKRPTAAFTL